MPDSFLVPVYHPTRIGCGNLLPLARELGAAPDITTIEDGEYNYLFEVKMPPRAPRRS